MAGDCCQQKHRRVDVVEADLLDLYVVKVLD